MSTSTTSRGLAAQNDAFRQGKPHTPALRGERVHTRGIEAFGLVVILDIWARV